MDFGKINSTSPVTSLRDFVGKKGFGKQKSVTEKKRVRSTIVDMILKGVLEVPPGFIKRIK